jgi:hypothetical protein
MKARARLVLILAAAVFAVASASALTSLTTQGGQKNIGAENAWKVAEDNLSQAALADEEEECRGPAERLPAAKLIIEHNSTDEDTGVHGLFDGVDWRRLAIFDPRGRLILEVEPKGQLRNQSISGIFFESAEPPNEEVPIEDFLRKFPEGRYTVQGCTKDGTKLKGSALFTHAIPAGPVITFPHDGDVVSASNLTITWNHVTATLDGRPLNRTGYQVIVTRESPDDPNGFSLPVLDVHLLPSITSLTIPNQFLEPGTSYELEVLVLEISGNQTITSLSFETR